MRQEGQLPEGDLLLHTGTPFAPEGVSDGHLTGHWQQPRITEQGAGEGEAVLLWRPEGQVEVESLSYENLEQAWGRAKLISAKVDTPRLHLCTCFLCTSSLTPPYCCRPLTCWNRSTRKENSFSGRVSRGPRVSQVPQAYPTNRRWNCDKKNFNSLFSPPPPAPECQ